MTFEVPITLSQLRKMIKDPSTDPKARAVFAAVLRQASKGDDRECEYPVRKIPQAKVKR